MFGFFKVVLKRLYCFYKHKGDHYWSYAYQVRQWRKGHKRGKSTHHRYEYRLTCECCGKESKWLRWKTFDDIFYKGRHRALGIHEES